MTPASYPFLASGLALACVPLVVLAHQWSVEEPAVEDATPARRRNAVKTAVLLALVG